MTLQLVCTRVPCRTPPRGCRERAVAYNPANRPNSAIVAYALGANPSRPGSQSSPGKRWHTDGVKLTVGFLDNPPAALRKRILSHMNAWAKTANVPVHRNQDQRKCASPAPANSGHGGLLSYEGTDILSIPANEPTMNLEAFTMKTERVSSFASYATKQGTPWASA